MSPVPSPASPRKSKRPQVRLTIGAMLLAGALVGAFGSQLWLQGVAAGDTVKLATDLQRYELVKREHARRGRILSSDGVALAEDQEGFDLIVNFSMCPDSPAFWLAVSSATRVPASELEVAAKSGDKTRVWPRALSQADQVKLDEVRARWRASGVSASQGGRRVYPLEDAAACVVGVSRPKGIVIDVNTEEEYELKKLKRLLEEGVLPKGGKVVADLRTGIESAQQAVLQGKDGESAGIADREGNYLPLRSNGRTRQAVPGSDVVLTLDSVIQTAAYQAVLETHETSKAKSVSAVVLDPSTGKILALANSPSFRPYNEDGSYGSLGFTGGANPTYMSLLEPGSMFKVLTLAKALDVGAVQWGDRFYCAGEWKAFKHGKPIRCDLHHGTRAHGDLDPGMAIARSCNIWAAKWALSIQRDPFIQYMRDLGLLARPELGLPGAKPALFELDPPAPQVQLARVGFGQSINVSPVALASAFATVANGGVHRPPRLIESVRGVAKPMAEAKRVLTSESCAKVLEAMKLVFESERGTGKTLKIPGYYMGGKTGTAEALGRATGKYVSNFIGVLPADRPRALILVMVDQPVGKYYGGEVAGPAYRKIAEAVIRRLKIQPDYAVQSSAARLLPPRKPAGASTSPEVNVDIEVQPERLRRSATPSTPKRKEA